MSAENAWRIAREILATMPTKYLARCPMPPAFEAAFRAEVEAEAEELRGMLSEAVAALESAPIEGKFGAGLNEYDRLCQALWDWRATIRAKSIIRDSRALLSRLEAKGKSHE